MEKRYTSIYIAWTVFILSYVLFALSFTGVVDNHVHDKDAKRVQKYLHREMLTASDMAEQLLKTPSWINTAEYQFAKNTALFVFKNNQLISWTNDVAVDDHILQGLDTQCQYIKLGSGWYVSRAFIADSLKIVVTVLIQKDYLFTNELLPDEFNSDLHFPKNIGVRPISPQDADGVKDGHAVFSLFGKPLFVMYALPSDGTMALVFRWIALFMMLASHFFFLRYYQRKSREILVIVSSLILLRFIVFFLPDVFSRDIPVFSPCIYAESSFFRSLGDLFLHAVCIFLVFTVFYIVRSKWRKYVQKLKKTPRKYRLALLFDAIGVLAFFFFIGYVIRSLVLNSTIALEPFRLSELSVYSLLAYSTIILLFASLFIQCYLFANNHFRKWLFLHNRYQSFFLFVLVIALYTLLIVSYYVGQKEKDQIVVWADKVATEHDPMAEMALVEIEPLLRQDPELQKLLHQTDQKAIVQMLFKNYFYSYMHRYDIKITVCSDGKDGKNGCRTRFDEMIEQEGEQIRANSNFYFLNNYNGRISYLGVLDCQTNDGIILYMELESKLNPLDDGYPDLLLDESLINKVKIPAIYSCAVYLNWRLMMSTGDYPYDMMREINTGIQDVEILKFDNYSHFFVRLNEHNVVVLSRPNRTMLMYAATFSYIFLFFALALRLLLYLLGWRSYLNIQRNTFRTKITTLLLSVLCVSMMCQGALTLWFGIEQLRSNNQQRMEDKISAVLVDMDDYLSTHDEFREEDAEVIFYNLMRLSNSLHVDINLYDSSGKLYVSSRPEIFERQLQSTRMNSKAIASFAKQVPTRYVHQDAIGKEDYYSMYAPIYNKNAELIGYANIPYFTQKVVRENDMSNVITAIVNVHILLLILVLLVGLTLSNNISQPLRLIRHNMRKFRLSKKLEYINYKQNDELGDLVYAYNHMIDVIEESSKKIAQNERESAWREMARQIAHEIKNPLTPMRLSIQHLMRMKKENKEGWQDRFDALATSLLEQIETMSRTASEFSNFAKSKLDMPTQVEMNAVLREQKSLFDNRTNISFELLSDVENAFVVGRRDQLVRVFVNLITNAIQALDDKPDGRIRVSLREVDRFYYITVEDNGPGVKPEMQRNLFTPNFTTKTSGSGLGLAISKNIINRKGGTIEYTSSVLGGACFLVKLPKQTL